MEDDYREFPVGERPHVEVLVEGAWFPGELRAWSRPSPVGGVWWGNVMCHDAEGEDRATVVRRDCLRVVGPVTPDGIDTWPETPDPQ